jgi:hypothetical protein
MMNIRRYTGGIDPRAMTNTTIFTLIVVLEEKKHMRTY